MFFQARQDRFIARGGSEKKIAEAEWVSRSSKTHTIDPSSLHRRQFEFYSLETKRWPSLDLRDDGRRLLDIPIADDILLFAKSAAEI